MKIQTSRLSLVPMRPEFLASTHEYAADPDNTKYMLFLPNDSIEDTKSYLKNAYEQWQKDTPEYYEFAIFHGKTHIGAVSLYPDKSRSSAELGWIINKRYQRRGYAFEAAQALLKTAAEKLGIHRFIAHCDTENIGSRRVMEKLGMVLKDEYGGRKNKQSDDERREFLYMLEV